HVEKRRKLCVVIKMDFSANGADRKADLVRIVRPAQREPWRLFPFHGNGLHDWNLDLSEVLFSDLDLDDFLRVTLVVRNRVFLRLTRHLRFRRWPSDDIDW